MADKKVITELSYIDGGGNRIVIYPQTMSEAIICDVSTGETLEHYLLNELNWYDCGTFEDTIVYDYDCQELVVSEFQQLVVENMEA